MYLSDEWNDYQVIDCGGVEKWERWGDVTLLRPDPQAIWPMAAPAGLDAHYIRESGGGGRWQFNRSLPEKWQVHWRDLRFVVRPTGFKHTGLFPEQGVNWAWMQERIAGYQKEKGRPARVLNLFAYTGGATVACLAAGAEVVHVDAAKGMVAWAKENAALNGLQERPVRWIVDAVLKFARPEERPERPYDRIILAPPTSCRGPGGEMWEP